MQRDVPAAACVTPSWRGEMQDQEATKKKSRLLTFGGGGKVSGAVMSATGWVNSKEFFVAATVIVFTVMVGIVGGSPVLSVLVATLVLSVATAVWAIREGVQRNSDVQKDLSAELVRFRQDLRRANEVLANMAMIPDQGVQEALRRISQSLAEAKDHRLLFTIVRRDITAVANELGRRSGRNSYDVWHRQDGKRLNEIVETFLDSLESGWSLDSLTNLHFWASDPLVRPGDLIDANVEAAARGVGIRRIFLVPPEYTPSQDELSVLVAHWELARANEKIDAWVTSPRSHEAWSDLGAFLLCLPSRSGDPMALELHYGQPKGKSVGGLDRIEIVQSRDWIERRRSRFERLLERATPVGDYLRQTIPDFGPDGPADPVALVAPIRY